MSVAGNASGQRRTKALKDRRHAEGLVEVPVWVPAEAAANLRQLAERLRTDRDLSIRPLRRISTGRLEKL